jgi:hypothetical protein
MITAQDIVMSELSLRDSINEQLVNARNNQRITSSSFTIPSERQLESADPESAVKYILALAKLKEAAVAGFLDRFAEIMNSGSPHLIGETAFWSVSTEDVSMAFQFNHLIRDANVKTQLTPELIQWLSDNGTIKEHSYLDYKNWIPGMTTPLGAPLLKRAWIKAKHDLISRMDLDVNGVQIVPENTSSSRKLEDCFIKGTDIWMITHYQWALNYVRPTITDVLNAKNQIIHDDYSQQMTDEKARRKISKENFTNYWSGMKQRIAENYVDKDEANSSFASIPLLPAGTESSRTWGIEIETVRADVVSRPKGWDRRYDGSLEPMYEDACDCECDDCCEYDSHCGYGDCTDSEDTCAEYVSPVLSSFNSAGVASICDDLANTASNSTPGIHIHVGAGDLSVIDISRLCVAYSAVSPFVWQIVEREYTGYCKDITSDNLAFWLADARDVVKRHGLLSASNTTSLMPRYRQDYQPDDRYHDLNLKSLAAHGTVEFRAMGPVYKYDHLVRWAWFCREMVNVSKLDLPQSTWTSVKSMADVIRILRTYGSEQLPKGMEKLYSKGDDLSVESNAELQAGQDNF